MQALENALQKKTTLGAEGVHATASAADRQKKHAETSLAALAANGL